MSTEQREFRPFNRVPSLDLFLDTWTLDVDHTEVQVGGRVILEEDRYLRAPIELRPPVDAQRFDELLKVIQPELDDLGIGIDDLGFAVNLSSKYLKISNFLHQVPFRDVGLLGQRIALTEGGRPDALRSPRSGCTVTAFVYLATEKTPAPRRPWRFGTWISRADFSVETVKAFTGFTPLPLTPEMKNQMGLSPGTARYVSLEEISPIEPGVSEDSVKVYVDSAVLAKLSAQPKSKGSVAFQRQLFIDAISTIVSTSRSEENFEELAWDDVRDSLLGRVLELLIPSNAEEPNRKQLGNSYLDMMKQNPARLMTYVEDAAGILSTIDDQLES
jgi:hypothetical protein